MARAVGAAGAVCGQVDGSRLLAATESSQSGRGHSHRGVLAKVTLCCHCSSCFSSSNRTSGKAVSSSLAAISASNGSSPPQSRAKPSRGKLWSMAATLVHACHAGSWIDDDSPRSCWLEVGSEFCGPRPGRHLRDAIDWRTGGGSGFHVSLRLLPSARRAVDRPRGIGGGLRRSRRPRFEGNEDDDGRRSSLAKMRAMVSSGDVEPEEIAWDKSLANSVHLIGRAGHDVDIKYLDTGKIVANLRLAVKRLGAAGQNQEPDWVLLELWGDLAETAANFVQKGRVIYVSGRLMVDTWTDRDTGKKQYATKVVVSSLKFVSSSSSDFASSREGGGRAGVGMMMAGGRTLISSSSRSGGAGGGGGGGGGRGYSSSPSLASASKLGSRWEGAGGSSTSSSTSPSPSPSTSSSPSMRAASSSSSPWSAMAASLEQQWETFFADPDAWWDNRIDKRNPRAPDFKHKETKDSLWVGSRGTPAWVADRLAAWDRTKESGSNESGRRTAADGTERPEEGAGDGEGLSSEDEENLLGGIKSWEKKEYGGGSNSGGVYLGRGRDSGLFSDQDFDSIAF